MGLYLRLPCEAPGAGVLSFSRLKSQTEKKQTTKKQKKKERKSPENIKEKAPCAFSATKLMFYFSPEFLSPSLHCSSFL